MATFLRVIRGGPPLLAALALVAGSPRADAAERASSHRFAIHGSLAVDASDKHVPASPWLRMDARLSTPPKDVGLASGGDFVVLAKLATSPLGCASDLIFADGFENLMF